MMDWLLARLSSAALLLYFISYGCCNTTSVQPSTDLNTNVVLQSATPTDEPQITTSLISGETSEPFASSSDTTSQSQSAMQTSADEPQITTFLISGETTEPFASSSGVATQSVHASAALNSTNDILSQTSYHTTSALNSANEISSQISYQTTSDTVSTSNSSQNATLNVTPTSQIVASSAMTHMTTFTSVPATSGGTLVPATSGGTLVPATSGGTLVPATSGGTSVPATSGGTSVHVATSVTQLLTTTAVESTSHVTSLESTTVILTPDTPGKVVILAVNSSTLNVTWSATNNTDSYRVVCIGIQLNVTYIATQTFYLLSGLAAGQVYNVGIAACFRNICSSYINASYNTYPNAPFSLAVVNRTTSSLAVQWNHTGGVDTYEIYVNDTQVLVNITVFAGQVTNLSVAGAVYCIAVRAVKGSLTAESVNCSPTVPSQPGVLTATNKTSSSFTIQWNQTGVFDNFTVRINEHYYDWNRRSDSSCQADIYDLGIAGGQYNVILSALSHGVESAVRYAEIFTVPPKPGNVTVNCDVTSMANQILIFISPPALSIDSYVISYYNISYISQNIDYPDTFSSSESFNSSGSSSSYNVARNGVRYLVQVSSIVNDLSSEPTTKYCTTAPGKVSSLAIVETLTNFVSFNWSAPSGYYSGFQVFCKSSQLEALNRSYSIPRLSGPDAAYAYNCTGLTAGVQYQVFIFAVLNNSETEIRGVPATMLVDTYPLPLTNFVATPLSFNEISFELQYAYAQNISQYSKISVYVDDQHHVEIDMSNFKATGKIPNLPDSLYITVNATAISSNSKSSSPYSYSSWTLPMPVDSLDYLSTSDSLITSWIPTGNKKTHNGYTLTVFTADKKCVKGIIFACGQNLPAITGYCASNNISNVACPVSFINYTVSGLTPSTNYTLSVVAVNDGGRSLDANILASTAAAAAAQQSGPSCSGGCVAGIVIGVIVGVALILVILYFVWRCRHPMAKPMKRSSYITGAANPAFLPGYEANEEVEIAPNPVRVSDFVQHVNDLHKDSGYKFSAEYELLKRLSKVHPVTAAEMPNNRVKNRYTNILPYDHSRVKLIPLDDDDETSDYINASYVPGYFSKREFIASQGPMKCTLDDFWRMIWEQNITSIVMLTNLTERNREKCECYWPTESEPVSYGDVEVQIKSESSLGHYVIRVVEVKVGMTKRELMQYHYTSWPDNGVPLDLSMLLDFLNCYQSNLRSQRYPVLVHCSAGVGRTGTFIVIDRLLQQIQREDTIDVFGTVLEMRDYRCNMIQTEAQYVFTHDCLKAAILKGVHVGKPLNGHANVDEHEYMNTSQVLHNPVDEAVYENTTQIHANSFDKGPFDVENEEAVGKNSTFTSHPAKRPQPAPRPRLKKDQNVDGSTQEVNLLEL